MRPIFKELEGATEKFAKAVRIQGSQKEFISKFLELARKQSNE